tara:strand:+ start:618 stop:5039 length:4422 start_codon:yes stop_codon:yes gene_type:complete
MIDLSVYPKFENDIQNKHTKIYPIIIFGEDEIDTGNYLAISTSQEMMPEEEGGTNITFYDYNLKLSNIKQSVDIENRKFQISNLSVTLSNYPKNDTRLSDILSQYSNRIVTVYYKSQSCIYLSDCIPIYRGNLRSYSFEQKNIKITLEDDTQVKFHKDVPIANVGYSEHVYSEDYKNKYIPIVYGEVHKAPAIPYKMTGEGNSSIKLLVDNVIGLNNDAVEIFGFGRSTNREEYNKVGEIDSPLYIYKDNYFNVLVEFQNIADEFIDYQDPLQFRIDDGNNSIIIDKLYSTIEPLNPPAFNELLCCRVTFGSDCQILVGEPEEQADGEIRYFTEDDTGKQVQDLLPTAFNLDGAIDSPDSIHNFILNTEDYLQTFTEIPDNHLIEEPPEDGVFQINELHRDELFYGGPDSYGDGYWETFNYAGRIAAWSLLHADQLVGEGVKIVEMPCADFVRDRLEAKLGELGYKVDNNNPITLDAGNIYCSQITAGLGGVPGDNGTNYDRSMPEQWVETNGKDINAREPWQYVEPVNQTNQNTSWTTYSGYYYYYKDSYGNYGNPQLNLDAYYDLAPPASSGGWYWSSSTGRWTYNSSQNISFDNSTQLRDSIFPSSFYIFGKPYRELHWDNISENGDFTAIVVGQKTSIVGNADEILANATGNALFINIFDDGSETPYLFQQKTLTGNGEIDEFCQFEPFSLSEPGAGGNWCLNPKWKANWNGVPIGDSNLNYGTGNTCLNGNSDYWTPMHHTSANNYAGAFYTRNYDVSPQYGGYSWHVYFPNGHNGDTIYKSRHGADYNGMIDPTANVKMNNHAFIPLGSVFSQANSYRAAMGYDFLVNTDPTFLSLTSPTEVVAESRLTLAFPMEELGASDAQHTITYPHLKIKCLFAESTNSTPSSGNTFEVRLSAGDIDSGQDGSFQFDIEEPSFGTTLISQTGGAGSVISDGGDFYFDTTYLPETPSNLFNWGSGSNHKIEDWVSPDSFNALLLTFRLKGELSKEALMRTNIHSVGLMQFTLFEKALDDEFYIDTYGRANTDEDIFEDNNQIYYKYTNAPLNDTIYKMPIDNPADIVYHFIEKELGLVDVMNRDSWLETRIINSGIKLGFSIQEQINSKELLEDISRSTLFFPKFNHEGEFSFMDLKREYQEGDSTTVLSDDVISVSINRTSVDKVYTIVNVKYEKDYAEDEYLKQTGYIDGYDCFGNGDGVGEDGLENGYKYSSFNIEREQNVLEFESDYIRDRQSALILRDFIYLNNCNQHTTMKVKLPIKYSYLEAGDVVRFDKLINGLKSYGEDYTSSDVYRNGQQIYPFFIVNSINKSTKNIELGLYQLHKLQRNFTAGTGSLSRMSQEGINAANPQDALNFTDLLIMEQYLANSYKYLTTDQKIAASILGNDYTSNIDYLILQNYVLYGGQEDFIIGDINQDGQVNIVDVVNMVNYILGGDINQEILDAIAEGVGDMNDDGVIDVIDIVNLVNQILGV